MSRQDLRGTCPGLPRAGQYAGQYANLLEEVPVLASLSLESQDPTPESEVSQLIRAHPGRSAPQINPQTKEGEEIICFG